MISSSQFSQPLILSLPQHKTLAQKVAQKLQIPYVSLEKCTFANSEIIVNAPITMRGKSVFLFHSMPNPVNESIFELLIAIDGLRRAAVNSISLIVPFLAYSRKEKKNNSRDPISAKLLANLLTTAGAQRIITINIHNPVIAGFYEIPFENWNFFKVLLITLLQTGLQNYVLASPDQSQIKPLKKLADMLDVPLVFCTKIRLAPNVSTVQSLVGDVKNRNVIFIDDMIDTGGTIVQAVQLAKKQGAHKVHILTVHGIFSNNALDKLSRLHQQGLLEKMWVSDSLPLPSSIKEEKFLQIVSLDDFLSKMLRFYIECGCLSNYLNTEQQILQKLRHE